MAEVTVIIPTRNRRHLLFRTLHSVLAQRAVSQSVVIVDDGGHDGTDKSLRALSDPRVQVVRHETRRGVSEARNTGLALAKTPWVAFVDDDDLWAPDKLPAQLAAVTADGSAQWSCAGSVVVDNEARVLGWGDPPYERDLSDLLLQSLSIPGGGSGVLAATSLARAVGGFDDTMSNLADWDFYLRLAQDSPVAAVHEPLVGYFLHPGSTDHDTLVIVWMGLFVGMGLSGVDVDTQIRAELTDFVVNNYLFGDAASRPGDDDSLVEGGIIDSTGILELIEFLESHFGIEVSETETVPQNLGSISNLTKFVVGKKAAAGSSL